MSKYEKLFRKLRERMEMDAGLKFTMTMGSPMNLFTNEQLREIMTIGAALQKDLDDMVDAEIERSRLEDE